MCLRCERPASGDWSAAKRQRVGSNPPDKYELYHCITSEPVYALTQKDVNDDGTIKWNDIPATTVEGCAFVFPRVQHHMVQKCGADDCGRSQEHWHQICKLKKDWTMKQSKSRKSMVNQKDSACFKITSLAYFDRLVEYLKNRRGREYDEKELKWLSDMKSLQ